MSKPLNGLPRPGDVLHVGSKASVQFVGDRAITLRVTRVLVLGSTPDGWAWLLGYQLDEHGKAVKKRDIFVQLAGLQHATAIVSRLPMQPRRDTATESSAA